MNTDFEKFLGLPDQECRDVFEAMGKHLSTEDRYVEKDFWVCYILDILYNRLPEGHPQFLFKGGTSLSKAFKLIQRFSEDIDMVISRGHFGFTGERDPLSPKISVQRRRKLLSELGVACSAYVEGQLKDAIEAVMGDQVHIALPEKKARSRQTLLIKYPSLYASSDTDYVQPLIKLEVGASSALEPATAATISPYISGGLNEGWSFDIAISKALKPSRTYLEKLMILHGIHCGYRDEKRQPLEGGRISRHYYDIAMMTGTGVGADALADRALLADVREHNEMTFKQAWRKLDEAVPGSIRLVPPNGLRKEIKKDYADMQGMIYSDAPGFEWIMEQVQAAEDKINKPTPAPI